MWHSSWKMTQHYYLSMAKGGIKASKRMMRIALAPTLYTEPSKDKLKVQVTMQLIIYELIQH